MLHVYQAAIKKEQKLTEILKAIEEQLANDVE
jgi:hypothetical protein